MLYSTRQRNNVELWCKVLCPWKSFFFFSTTVQLILSRMAKQLDTSNLAYFGVFSAVFGRVYLFTANVFKNCYSFRTVRASSVLYERCEQHLHLLVAVKLSQEIKDEKLEYGPLLSLFTTDEQEKVNLRLKSLYILYKLYHKTVTHNCTMLLIVLSSPKQIK